MKKQYQQKPTRNYARELVGMLYTISGGRHAFFATDYIYTTIWFAASIILTVTLPSLMQGGGVWAVNSLIAVILFWVVVALMIPRLTGVLYYYQVFWCHRRKQTLLAQLKTMLPAQEKILDYATVACIGKRKIFGIGLPKIFRKPRLTMLVLTNYRLLAPGWWAFIYEVAPSFKFGGPVSQFITGKPKPLQFRVGIKSVLEDPFHQWKVTGVTAKGDRLQLTIDAAKIPLLGKSHQVEIYFRGAKDWVKYLKPRK